MEKKLETIGNWKKINYEETHNAKLANTVTGDTIEIERDYPSSREVDVFTIRDSNGNVKRVGKYHLKFNGEELEKVTGWESLVEKVEDLMLSYDVEKDIDIKELKDLVEQEFEGVELYFNEIRNKDFCAVKSLYTQQEDTGLLFDTEGRIAVNYWHYETRLEKEDEEAVRDAIKVVKDAIQLLEYLDDKVEQEIRVIPSDYIESEPKEKIYNDFEHLKQLNS